MRTILLPGLMVGLVLGQLRAKEVKTPEKATFKIASLIVDGKEVPADELKNWRLTVEGDKYLVKNGDKVVEKGTAKVDMTKTPWQIDRTDKAGVNKGKTFKGIMKAEGDKATVCWAPAGEARPKEFSSKKGSGHILEIVERITK